MSDESIIYRVPISSESFFFEWEVQDSDTNEDTDPYAIEAIELYELQRIGGIVGTPVLRNRISGPNQTSLWRRDMLRTVQFTLDSLPVTRVVEEISGGFNHVFANDSLWIQRATGEIEALMPSQAREIFQISGREDGKYDITLIQLPEVWELNKDDTLHWSFKRSGKKDSLLTRLAKGKFQLELSPKQICRGPSEYWVLVYVRESVNSIIDRIVFRFMSESETQVTTRKIQLEPTDSNFGWEDLIRSKVPEFYSEPDLDPDGAHEKLINIISRALWDNQMLVDQWPNLHDSTVAPEFILPTLASSLGWKLRTLNPNRWRSQIGSVGKLWRNKGTVKGISQALELCGCSLDQVRYYNQVRSSAFFTETLIFANAVDKIEVGLTSGNEIAYNPIFKLSRSPFWVNQLLISGGRSPDLSAVKLEARSANGPTWYDITPYKRSVFIVESDSQEGRWSDRFQFKLWSKDVNGNLIPEVKGLPASDFNEIRITYPIDTWADQVEEINFELTTNASLTDPRTSTQSDQYVLLQNVSSGLSAEHEFVPPFILSTFPTNSNFWASNASQTIEKELKFELGAEALNTDAQFSWTQNEVVKTGVKLVPSTGASFIPPQGTWQQITSGLWLLVDDEAYHRIVVTSLDGSAKYSLDSSEAALFASQTQGVFLVLIKREGELPVQAGSQISFWLRFRDLRLELEAWPQWQAQLERKFNSGAGSVSLVNDEDDTFNSGTMVFPSVGNPRMPNMSPEPLCDWKEIQNVLAAEGVEPSTQGLLTSAGEMTVEITPTFNIALEGITSLDSITSLTPEVIQAEADPGNFGAGIFLRGAPYTLAASFRRNDTGAIIMLARMNAGLDGNDEYAFLPSKCDLYPGGVGLYVDPTNPTQLIVERGKILHQGDEILVQPTTLKHHPTPVGYKNVGIVQLHLESGVCSIKYGPHQAIATPSAPAPDAGHLRIAQLFEGSSPNLETTIGLSNTNIFYAPGYSRPFMSSNPGATTDLVELEYEFGVTEALLSSSVINFNFVWNFQIIPNETVGINTQLWYVDQENTDDHSWLGVNHGLTDKWQVTVQPLAGNAYSVPAHQAGSPLRWKRFQEASDYSAGNQVYRYRLEWKESAEWPMPEPGSTIKVVYPRYHGLWTRFAWYDQTRIESSSNELRNSGYHSFNVTSRWDRWAQIQVDGARTYVSCNIERLFQDAINTELINEAQKLTILKSRYLALLPVYRYDYVTVNFRTNEDWEARWGARLPKSALGYDPISDGRHTLLISDRVQAEVREEIIWNSPSLLSWTQGNDQEIVSLNLNWAYMSASDVFSLRWISPGTADLPMLLDAVLRGKTPTPVGTLAEATTDWVQAYLMTLPLADTRDVRDLFTYQEWKRQRLNGIIAPLSNPCPPIDFNTRLIAREDPVYQLICPSMPYPDEVTFGYIRTQLPYGVSVYGVDEYDGSTRPSQRPADIDVSFTEPCACAPASHFGLDVTLGLDQSEMDEAEVRNLIHEFKPAHSILRFLRTRRRAQAFTHATVQLGMKIKIHHESGLSALHLRSVNDLKGLGTVRSGMDVADVNAAPLRDSRSTADEYPVDVTVLAPGDSGFDTQSPWKLNVDQVLWKGLEKIGPTVFKNTYSAADAFERKLPWVVVYDTNQDVVGIFASQSIQENLWDSILDGDLTATVAFDENDNYHFQALRPELRVSCLNSSSQRTLVEQEVVSLKVEGFSFKELNLRPGLIIELYEQGNSPRRAMINRVLAEDHLHIIPASGDAATFCQTNGAQLRGLAVISPKDGNPLAMIRTPEGQWTSERRIPTKEQIESLGITGDRRSFLVMDQRTSTVERPIHDWFSFSLTPEYAYELTDERFKTYYILQSDVVVPTFDDGDVFTEPMSIIDLDRVRGAIRIQRPNGVRISGLNGNLTHISIFHWIGEGKKLVGDRVLLDANLEDRDGSTFIGDNIAQASELTDRTLLKITDSNDVERYYRITLSDSSINTIFNDTGKQLLQLAEGGNTFQATLVVFTDQNIEYPFLTSDVLVRDWNFTRDADPSRTLRNIGEFNHSGLDNDAGFQILASESSVAVFITIRDVNTKQRTSERWE